METRFRSTLLMFPLASLLLFCGKQDDVRPDPGNGAQGAGAGGGAGGAGTAGANAGAKPHECPKGLPGPALVEVKGPDGTPYCIDKTEVTQAHYAEFLKAKAGDVSGQVPECDGERWDPQMEEPETVGRCPYALYDPAKFPTRPMLCTSWCMARGYCEWAGKRLCRRIGGGTITTIDESGAKDPQGEWYNACSQGGKTVYPYGDTWDPDKCATTGNQAVKPLLDPNLGAALDASNPAIAACHGTEPPYDQILHMSGNVTEWEDACFASPFHPPPGVDILCRIRGGATLSQDEQKSLQCGADGYTSIRVQHAVVGIRCCAD